MSLRLNFLIGLVAALSQAPIAQAQDFPLSPEDVADSAALTRSMPQLAESVLAVYRDTSRIRFFDNVARLYILTGKCHEAVNALTEARALRSAIRDTTLQQRALNTQYEIFASACAASAGSGRAFRETFADAFRAKFAQLDDRTAAWSARALLVSARTAASDLRWATPDLSGRTHISLDEALTLLRIYSAAESYRAFAGMPAILVAEDDARRYVIETNVAVKTPQGSTICAIIVRPRSTQARLPALLQFTIYADSITSMRDALLAASNGYAGITGFTRGKACSPDETVPYRHDGVDAAALIDWIGSQSWSDGRVGMYGGSYSGFTAWAAAKHMPKALKAIMVGAPAGPGIDVPMEGNVFWNFVYPWPFYTTNNRWLDNVTYFDNARWNRLYQEWYRSGRAYRDLEEIDGTPNPGFMEWLAHPTLDEYWRTTIPQGKEYAAITIPVLQTAGYFFGGPGAATYYFLEHYRHNPRARHYLLVGPWDHIQAQRGVVTTLGDTATFFAGYSIDPVAQLDLVADLRYQWFDHVLRGAPLPALLKDRFNYQVTGANEWQHAPSIAAASNGRLRLYISEARSAGRYTLSEKAPPSSSAIAHTVNLADRTDADMRRGGGLMDTQIDSANAVVLMSEPLAHGLDVNGLLSGHLELITNKRDFDFTITMYELTADGRYFQLPPYTSRASHVESLSERRLLAPGRRQRLDFRSHMRPVSRRVSAGSRFVVVLAVVKNAGQQINYGTGKPVSEESIADAGDPLTIRWLGGSYVDLPVRR